jgi:hypothetical protein
MRKSVFFNNLSGPLTISAIMLPSKMEL